MRLRLVCAIATTLPIAIDSTASTTSIWLQSGCETASASGSSRMASAKAASFEAVPMNSVTQVGRSFIHIRDPHVERHGAQLEADADDQERDAEEQADVGGEPALHGRRDARQLETAR